METLNIKKEAAIVAHENAKSSGKKLLEDLFGKRTFQKEVTERVKTFDDVLRELDYNSDDFKNECSVLEADEKAYRKVKLIAEALNEGWKPDWGNSSQYKYYPWFHMGGSSGSGFACYDCGDWNSLSSCGSRLCFKSRELAKYAGELFTDIYKDFLTL